MNPFLYKFFAFFKPKVEPKPSAMTEPVIKKLPLKPEQYYQVAYPKKHIFLHHSAGGSAASSIAHWASNPDHIATAFVIDRDGTIYETFDPKYWAYHLGVRGNSIIERSSIGIEICSYGALDPATLETYTGKVIPVEKTVKLDTPFRNYRVWEKYTAEQIASLSKLLPYLLDRFKIPMQPDRKEFWEHRNPATLLPGVWSHSTVRLDKIDIFPQRELVELIMGL